MNARALSAILLLVLLVNPLLAQPDETMRTTIRQLVDQLGSDSWLERDHASIELSVNNLDITLEDLEFYLSDPTLTLEQRFRLEQACLYRYLAYPKGGLGVSFGSTRIGAVEVQPIKPDPRFPASAMLNPGDAIAMVGDDLIESQFDLRAQILSRRPGETLPVTLLRADKVLHMELPLGSLRDLSGAASFEPMLAWRSLELRWKRMGIERFTPDRVGHGIRLDQWQSSAFPREIEPNPKSPTQRYIKGMVVGAKQFIAIGRLALPRRVRIWESRQQLGVQIDSVRFKLKGFELERFNAQRDVLIGEIEQLKVQADNAQAGASRKEIEAQLQELSQRLEELESHSPIQPLPEIEEPIPTP